MTELIKITEHDGRKAVSARELHAFLESKQDFSTWIKARIKKYGFVENQDYEVFNNFIKNPDESLLHNFVEQNGSGGYNKIEYALSISCAKELAMVEGNAKGKQARQYFIACEEKAKQLSKPLSTLELLELTIKGMRETGQELQEVKRDVLELKARTQTRPDYFTIVGYGTLHHVSVNLKQAGILGRRATKLCNERGITTDRIPDPRFGEVKMYPSDVLEEVFNQPIM